MLNDKRSKVENKIKARDIIQEYGNFGSRVYAPKAFEGTFRDKPSATLQLAVHDTNTFHGLLELEKTLPQGITNPKISLPEAHKLKSLDARKEKQLQIELELMSAKIQERKQRDTKAEEPVKYAIKIERPPSRAPTPTIAIPYLILTPVAKKTRSSLSLPCCYKRLFAADLSRTTCTKEKSAVEHSSMNCVRGTFSVSTIPNLLRFQRTTHPSNSSKWAYKASISVNKSISSPKSSCGYVRNAASRSWSNWRIVPDACAKPNRADSDKSRLSVEDRKILFSAML
jgi:hypothetical protein